MSKKDNEKRGIDSLDIQERRLLAGKELRDVREAMEVSLVGNYEGVTKKPECICEKVGEGKLEKKGTEKNKDIKGGNLVKAELMVIKPSRKGVEREKVSEKQEKGNEIKENQNALSQRVPLQYCTNFLRLGIEAAGVDQKRA